MTDDEKLELAAIVGVIAFIVGIIIFFLVPVTEKVKVEEVNWHWTVGVMEYQKCYENKWGREEYEYADGKEHFFGSWDGLGYDSPFKNHERDRANAVPAGAYDIVEKVEKYGEKKVTLSEDDYYYVDVYRYKYYYYINRWKESVGMVAGGHDKNPHEPECDLPYSITEPQLGDRVRTAGHSESYSALCRCKGKVEGTTVCKTYILTKAQWSDLRAGDTIVIKRRRFGNKVKEMQICQ